MSLREMPRAVAAGLVLLAAAMAGCNSTSGGGKAPASSGEVSVSVSLQGALATQVVRVVATASRGDGPGFPTLYFELARDGDGWSAFVTGVPAGPGRRFDVTALDGTGAIAASGWGKADIVPGVPARVSIQLSTPGSPYDNQLPVIDYLSASTGEASPGATVTLRVSASDPDPGDTLTYAWSASCGSFDDPAATLVVWTAPQLLGRCDLTITVSDGRAEVKATLPIAVRSSARAVSGMRLATFWPDAPSGKVSVPAPDTLTALPPHVVGRDGSGAWTVKAGGHVGPGGAFVAGSFGADGSFVVPDVPRGDYVLCYRPPGAPTTCVDAAADLADLGYDVLGRPDQLPAVSPTPVTFVLTGADAWNPLLESIEITSSGANVWDVIASGPDLRGGAVAGTVREDWSHANGTRQALNLLAAADVLHVHQLSVRSLYSAQDLLFYTAATHGSPALAGATVASGIALQDGQAATITRALEALPLDAGLEVDWAPAAWEAHASALGPPARTATGPEAHRLTVAASAFLPESPSPAAAGWPRLVRMSLPAGAGPVAGTAWYGRFLPASWGEWREVAFEAGVTYLAPGASQPWLEPSGIDRRDALPAAAGPSGPSLTPVRSPRIDGADAFEDHAGVAETPTLSWEVPAVGAPTAYRVEVARLDASGEATVPAVVLRYATVRTRVTLPPGVLEAGKAYFARIVAIASSAPATAPYRQATLRSQAAALTGVFSR